MDLFNPAERASVRRAVGVVASLSLVLLLASCAITPEQKARNVQQALASGPLRDSFYACLLNLYYQGLSLEQIKKECETRVVKRDTLLDFSPARNPRGGPDYDPIKAITAACVSGDPRRSAGTRRVPGWGDYSWGKPRGAEAYFKGLSEAESKARKDEAIRRAEEAEKEFQEKEQKEEEAKKEAEKAAKSGDPAKADAAKAAHDKALQEAVEAARKALEAAENARHDPNEADAYVRTTQDPSLCEQALQDAREFLWECHRTTWKSYQCQALKARMNYCPDPAQIYVDPEQGYSCTPKIDAEELKKAWVARCEELKRPGPDGHPCEPPKVEDAGRYIAEATIDWCKDERIYVDPHGADCAKPFHIQPFGRDLQQLIVWALNKFGGPIVVLPPRGAEPVPKPRPGPDPRPVPQ